MDEEIIMTNQEINDNLKPQSDIVIKEQPTDNKKSFKELSNEEREQLPKKKRLIYDIKKICHVLDKPIDKSERDLNRMSLKSLEQWLAELCNQGTSQILTNSSVVNVPETAKSVVNDDVAISALYRLHLSVCMLAEKGTIMLKDKLPTTLSGFTDKNMKKEKEIRECLKLIMPSYGDSLKSYLNPVSIYALLMFQIMGETLIENRTVSDKPTIKTTEPPNEEPKNEPGQVTYSEQKEEPYVTI